MKLPGSCGATIRRGIESGTGMPRGLGTVHENIRTGLLSIETARRAHWYSDPAVLVFAKPLLRGCKSLVHKNRSNLGSL